MIIVKVKRKIEEKTFGKIRIAVCRMNIWEHNTESRTDLFYQVYNVVEIWGNPEETTEISRMNEGIPLG